MPWADIFHRPPRLLELLWPQLYDAGRAICVGIRGPFGNASHVGVRIYARSRGSHALSLLHRNAHGTGWQLYPSSGSVFGTLFVELVLDLCQAQCSAKAACCRLMGGGHSAKSTPHSLV